MKKLLLSILLYRFYSLRHLLLVFVFLFLWTFSSINSYAQVSVNPATFKAEDEITITYDATQGTSGLRGASKVYMHAGVILDSEVGTGWNNVVGNWGKDDGIGLMTALGNDKWSIKLVPRVYFGVPAQRIFRIGMVFRNADGSREGKSPQNGDIFIQVAFSGLAMSIVSPNPRPYFAFPNENFEVKAEASASATLSILVNGKQVKEQVGTMITHTVNAGTANGLVKIMAKNSTNAVSDSFTYSILPPQVVAPLPSGVQDGINYIDEKTVVLVLFAPQKKFVYTIGDFNDWQVGIKSFMNVTPDKNRFWLRLENLAPRKEYVFQYLIDGNIRIGDPYSEKILDPNNDRFIENTVYPDPTPYPTGKTTDLASVLQTGQIPYTWKNTNFKRPDPQDLVIYELHLRDFSTAHNYQAVLDSLDYLKRLGINAIQLMPIQEFEGNDSWGYNPIYYFAPDKYYGTKNMLKEFVDKAHEKGFAIILDMVLNHNFGQSPLVKMYWDSKTNKPAEGNPYFNPDATHPFNVGYDFNHESQAVKDLVKKVNQFWLTEYKIDGFRFDLSKGFTQKNNPNNESAWSAFDASRIATWKRIYDEIRMIDNSAYIILEHFAQNSEEIELSDYGMLLWGNMNDAFGKAIQGVSNSIEGTTYLQRSWQKPHLVSFMESHDEERLLVKALEGGQNADSYNIKNLTTALERAKLAATFYFPLQGPKMIWQFGELGYDVSINQNGRTGRKPIRWEYAQNADRQKLYKTYAALIRLKSLPESADALRSKNSQLIERNMGLEKQFILQSPNLNMVILGNFGLRNADFKVNFPNTGTWFDYFTGESIEVIDKEANLFLQRGQFHILTNKKLPTPERNLVLWTLAAKVVAVEDAKFEHTILLYPNPAHHQVQIRFSQAIKGTVKVSLKEISGKTLRNWQFNLLNEHESIDLQGITTGFYFMEIDYNNKKVVKKLIIE
jgi:glycosidase